MKSVVSVLLIVSLTQGQDFDQLPRLPFPPSPCPAIFSYNQTKPYLNTWLGGVAVSVNTPTQGLRLRVTFTEKLSILASNMGEVWTTDNKDFTILDLKQELKPEKTIAVWLLVTYGDLDPVPHVKTIELNGKKICPVRRSVPQDTGPELFPSGRPKQGIRNKPNNSKEASSASNEGRLSQPEECGKIKITSAKELILNSEAVPYGHAPWHAALYQYDTVDRNFKYSCGGTLISATLILTAAHCVITPGSANNRPLRTDALLINLGKYSARATSEDGVQDKRVSEIHVHPKFITTTRTMRNDIAMLKLATPASINDLVRPICLWEKDNTDLANVVNKQGTVVGWGFEADNKLTEQLRKTKMPIVSTETCILSDTFFFGAYANNGTFCAGSPPTGSTVCNGDSGGGMIFKKDEDLPDDETVWRLRGIISLGAGDLTNRCDPRHYVVFVDVAKYLDWIASFLDEE